MAKEMSLLQRLYADPVWIAVARSIGYVGYPVRELAERTKEIVRQHGARKVSEALQEIASFQGNRVMLQPRPRDLCWQLLGPPPEAWERFYRNADGTPVPRPPGRETPPIIPEREIDPITDGLRLLTYTQLVEMLQKARRIAAGESNMSHLRKLSLEQIPCVESEMIRRGMDVPPLESAKEEKPKKAKKKKAG